MARGYHIERYLNKEDWLANHQTRIGGSSAGTILGVNAWQTKLDLYNAIVNPVRNPKSKKATANITIGNECEPLIRNTFRVMFPNFDVIDPNGFEVYVSNKYPQIIATLDGTIREKTGKQRLGILEIKTRDICSKKDYDEWFEFDPIYKKNVVKAIKQQYFAQVCHYFNVLNDAKFAYVVVQFRFFDWHSPLENKVEHLETHFIYIDREEVKESCETLLKLELAFLDDCKNRRMPPLKIKI